ncbi:MAG: ImmA/IrrE family metallo-endopeptidase [Candidatus Aquicultor sp.]|nr:ImmA/IrrE family metallo-endopeptidase [Candidatus Aquicultor sp.]
MPIYTHNHIKEQANNLIKECNITKLPVDVRGIAYRLGIEVVEMSTDSWFYGMLTRYHDDFYIVINKMMPESRKRFTIAHELGHYKLHNDDLGYQRSPDKDHYHREADVFALELCIPTSLLKQEAYSWFNDHKFLADLFNVSEVLMVKKMEDLELIPKGKHNWDYAQWKAV